MNDSLTITLDSKYTSAHRYILLGRISAADANILQYELEEALKNGHKHFILNMRQVSYLSSSGIRILLMFRKIANEKGGNLYIENPSENVVNVLGMTALDEMLLK